MAIRFQFVCSGDDASYRIVGGPFHDRRFAVAQPAPEWSSRRYNYTQEEYQRLVRDVDGYLHWEGYATEMFPMEYARQFEAEHRAEWQRAYDKYGDKFVRPYAPIKGVAKLDPTYHHWIKENL